MSPPYRKSVGFYEFYSCAPLEHIEWVAPHFHWESKRQSYCRYAGLGQWRDAAMNRNFWDQHGEKKMHRILQYRKRFM